MVAQRLLYTSNVSDMYIVCTCRLLHIPWRYTLIFWWADKFKEELQIALGIMQ
jgi:hypothetical protein